MTRVWTAIFTLSGLGTAFVHKPDLVTLYLRTNMTVIEAGTASALPVGDRVGSSRKASMGRSGCSSHLQSSLFVSSCGGSRDDQIPLRYGRRDRYPDNLTAVRTSSSSKRNVLGRAESSDASLAATRTSQIAMP